MVAPPGGSEYQQRVPQSSVEQVAVYREITIRHEPPEVVRVEISQTGDFRLM
jgi:predicted RNA methylase